MGQLCNNPIASIYSFEVIVAQHCINNLGTRYQKAKEGYVHIMMPNSIIWCCITGLFHYLCDPAWYSNKLHLAEIYCRTATASALLALSKEAVSAVPHLTGFIVLATASHQQQQHQHATFKWQHGRLHCQSSNNKHMCAAQHMCRSLHVCHHHC